MNANKYNLFQEMAEKPWGESLNNNQFQSLDSIMQQEGWLHFAYHKY